MYFILGIYVIPLPMFIILISLNDNLCRFSKKTKNIKKKSHLRCVNVILNKKDRYFSVTVRKLIFSRGIFKEV